MTDVRITDLHFLCSLRLRAPLSSIQAFKLTLPFSTDTARIRHAVCCSTTETCVPTLPNSNSRLLTKLHTDTSTMMHTSLTLIVVTALAGAASAHPHIAERGEAKVMTDNFKCVRPSWDDKSRCIDNNNANPGYVRLTCTEVPAV